MPIFDLDQMTKRNSLKEDQKDERVIVGYIDFSNYDEFLDEDYITKSLPISKLGMCSIEVYRNEGMYIPHMHIKSSNNVKGNRSNRPFDCCVKIFKPEYFSHSSHSSKFKNNSQCKDLDKWLRLKSTIDDKDCPTNWHRIVKLWIIFNGYPIDIPSNTKIHELIQPDYTLLK